VGLCFSILVYILSFLIIKTQFLIKERKKKKESIDICIINLLTINAKNVNNREATQDNRYSHDQKLKDMKDKLDPPRKPFLHLMTQNNLILLTSLKTHHFYYLKIYKTKRFYTHIYSYYLHILHKFRRFL